MLSGRPSGQGRLIITPFEASSSKSLDIIDPKSETSEVSTGNTVRDYNYRYTRWLVLPGLAIKANRQLEAALQSNVRTVRAKRRQPSRLQALLFFVVTLQIIFYSCCQLALAKRVSYADFDDL